MRKQFLMPQDRSCHRLARQRSRMCSLLLDLCLSPRRTLHCSFFPYRILRGLDPQFFAVPMHETIRLWGNHTSSSSAHSASISRRHRAGSSPNCCRNPLNHLRIQRTVGLKGSLVGKVVSCIVCGSLCGCTFSRTASRC